MAPDGDLVATLAHEVGHSIDPCNFQMPKWNIDRDKLKEYLAEDPMMSKMDRAEVDEMMAGEQSYYMDPKLTISNDKVLNELISKGILTKVSDGFSPSQYPFKEEYACLTTKAGFQDVNQKDIADSIAYLKRAAVLADDQKQSNQVIGRYEQAMKQYPQCFASATHKSQMGEVAGDMMGAIVEEKFVSEHPFKSEEEKVGSSVFISNSCNSDKSKSDNVPSPMVVSQFAFDRLRDEHPMDDSRLNRISFTMQGLADAYGCKKATPACLDHLSLVSRSGKSSRSSSESQGGRQ